MFKELTALLKPGADLVITITSPAEGKVTLAILRKHFADSLPPLVVTASAEELDARFAELIMTPLQTTAVALSNSEQYEKLAKKMEEEKRAKLAIPKKNAAAPQKPASKSAPPERADTGENSPSDDAEEEEAGPADGSRTPPTEATDTDQLSLFK
ncbi:MAG TPA: PRTRC system protein E [bacterium]|nr:PRTRC system protein E [bacterium]